MTLLETQRRFAQALMAPRAKRLAAALIKPNVRLSSLERLDIYARSYWARLLDSLREDFPGLATLLGPRAFKKLARAYLADCPSRSFTLRDLGQQLESWLTRHPGFAGANPELALDMVRLEWAHIVAFDGPSGQPLSSKSFARVGLQPCLSLLKLHYPVDEPRLAPVRELRFLAVHRVGLTVYYRRLSPEQFRLLSAIRAGQTIAAAIETAFEGTSLSANEIPELLRLWFSTWSQNGWLTRPPRNNNRGLLP